MGVIFSYFGWDGKHDSDMTMSINAAWATLAKTGLRDEFFIIELNDSGWTVDEIAVHNDSIDNNRDNEMYMQ